MSLFFVSLWVFLFGLGIYLVFLFLNGFSFFDSRVLQRGYAYFSSTSPLYLEGAYIENSKRYAQYEMGSYDLCVDEFEKKERCYDSVVIGGNDGVSQRFDSVFLMPENIDNLLFSLSEKGDLVAFSSKDGAFLWYDSFLRQVFYVVIGEEGVQSVFPEFPVVSVVYDKDLHRFVISGKKKDELFYVEVGSYTPSVSKEEYDFRNYFFSFISRGDGLFAGIGGELKGVFLQQNKASYSLEDGRFVLFFNDSVYLFSSVQDTFQFISTKDRVFDGICNAKENRCFYMKDGIFRFIQL